MSTKLPPGQTKTEAVWSMRARGMSYAEIAKAIGSSVKSAQNLYSRRLLMTEATAVADEPGWTPEKIEKARRIITKALAVIAKALSVSVEELMLHGFAPADTAEAPAAAPEPAQEPPPPEAVAEEPPEEEAPPAAIYRLQSDGGAWLHHDTSKLTWRISEAWCGTAQDIERVYALRPAIKKYEPIKVISRIAEAVKN